VVVGVRCGFHVSIGCCWLWASCLDGEVVAEAVAHSYRIAAAAAAAVVVVVPVQISL
jgi:hypothetical protein